MIHGGGFMTLSKTAIRPYQTLFLLEHGILPVSLDYRLCPEVTLVDGPMADVRDALAWAQTSLPAITRSHGFGVDSTKIAMIGWSTGGYLAMTTAWRSVETGLEPPKAILNFYGPCDFEALSKQAYPRSHTASMISNHSTRSSSSKPRNRDTISKPLPPHGRNPQGSTTPSSKSEKNLHSQNHRLVSSLPPSRQSNSLSPNPYQKPF